jgi:DNA polymerase II small subunit
MDIAAFLHRGILIGPEFDKLGFADLDNAKEMPLVLDGDFSSQIIDWKEHDKKKALAQKRGASPGTVTVVRSYGDENTKKTIKDFVSLYSCRFMQIQSILRQRQELNAVTSIKKASQSQDKETVTMIGAVLEIGITKNNNIMLTLEDPTGTIKAVVSKNNKECFEAAKEITQDEIIGITGTKSDTIVFVSTITFPDVPLIKELKKSPIDEAALMIGDIHFGAKAFLTKEFDNLILWLNGKYGDDQQKELSKKVKYLFVMGDLVEGIGIFPDQEKDLIVPDIYEQYKLFSDAMKKIPEHISIIITPGNHDSVRIAEPQPPIPQEMLPWLYARPNTYFVSSPSIVNIGSTNNFSGFDFLLYHGFSFPYYAANIESLRMAGGMERTDNIMVFLLKKRHLAPTHGSTQYQLGYKDDPLVIDQIPDFFATGHIHRATARNYRNITLLNCSCWVAQTEYQEQRGLVPDPARAIYVNLQTRETKIIAFEGTPEK